MLAGLEVSSLACKCDLNIMHKGKPKELNFEDLEMQK